MRNREKRSVSGVGSSDLASRIRSEFNRRGLLGELRLETDTEIVAEVAGLIDARLGVLSAIRDAGLLDPEVSDVEIVRRALVPAGYRRPEELRREVKEARDGAGVDPVAFREKVGALFRDSDWRGVGVRMLDQTEE